MGAFPAGIPAAAVQSFPDVEAILVGELLAEGAAAGSVRSDIAPGELAGYCLHALAAAGGLPSEAGVHRLLAVTMAGLRPPPAG